jgi:hypothetical protein
MLEFLLRSDWTLAVRGGAHMKHSFRQDLPGLAESFAPAGRINRIFS